MTRCNNAEPGTFGHECGRPATWRGGKPAKYPDMADADGLFWAAFCDDCKRNGTEARRITAWQALPATERTDQGEQYLAPGIAPIDRSNPQQELDL